MASLAFRLSVFALASTFAALCGCSVYNESLVRGTPGGRNDAVDKGDDAPDAGSGPVKDPPGSDCQHGRCWWTKQHPDGCESSGAPSPMQRPKDDDPEASSIKDLYLGWFRTRLGETSIVGGDELTWQQYGFDLDGTCTNSATCRDVQDQLSCRGATARIPFDGELCRDNSFGSLHAIAAAMPEVGDRFGLKHERVNCGLWRGDYSVVMRVSGYNGQSNDAKVRLDLYVGAGLEALPPWSCPADDFDTRYPHWRQSSAWRIDTAALRGEIETPGELPDSTMRDANAYVREGYLVATFPEDVALRFTGDGASYRGFSLTLHRSTCRPAPRRHATCVAPTCGSHSRAPRTVAVRRARTRTATATASRLVATASSRATNNATTATCALATVARRAALKRPLGIAAERFSSRPLKSAASARALVARRRS